MIKHRLLRAILFAGFLGASTAPVFAQAEGLGMPGDHITGFVEISIDDADALGLWDLFPHHCRTGSPCWHRPGRCSLS